MPISTPTFKPGNVSIDIINATTPRLTNLTMDISPNTESSHTLVTNLKQILIRARNSPSNHTLKFSYTSGESGTVYITLLPGAVYERTDLDLVAGTLFIQSNVASSIVEIEEWS